MGLERSVWTGWQLKYELTFLDISLQYLCQQNKGEDKMKNVKIRLLTDRGTHIWLIVDYFPKWRGGGVDSYYLTNNAR